VQTYIYQPHKWQQKTQPLQQKNDATELLNINKFYIDKTNNHIKYGIHNNSDF